MNVLPIRVAARLAAVLIVAIPRTACYSCFTYEGGSLAGCKWWRSLDLILIAVLHMKVAAGLATMLVLAVPRPGPHCCIYLQPS
jgi:hypothetical protein